MIFSCVLLFTLVSTATCNPRVFLRSGKCPTPEVKKDLNLSRMKGQWYEISRFPSQWEFGKCIQLFFEMTEDKKMKMTWEQILPNSSINFAESIAAAKLDSEASKLTLNFTKPYIPWETPFWIVDTDYDNYALIYSCYPYFLPGLKRQYNTEFAWIMSRDRIMDDNLKKKHKYFLRRRRIYTNMFIDNVQTGCEEYENDAAHRF